MSLKNLPWKDVQIDFVKKKLIGFEIKAAKYMLKLSRHLSLLAFFIYSYARAFVMTLKKCCSVSQITW